MDQDLEDFTIIVGLRMSQRTIISTGLLLLLMVIVLLVTYGEPVRLTQASREIWGINDCILYFND